MAVDNKNILRVDLLDCYREAERISVYRSHTINQGLQSDEIAICESDYPMLHTFAMEGCSKIADSANYIANEDETGLEALTFKVNEFTDLYQGNVLVDVPEKVKLVGESMSYDPKDTVIFNIPELEGVELIKYTTIQTFLKEAIVHYILYKWYHSVGMYRERDEEEGMFEKAVGNVRFNSVTNKKRIYARRKYRPWG